MDDKRLVERRRKYKTLIKTYQKQIEKYKSELKQKKNIRIVKINWLQSKCEEIEMLEKKHDSFNLHTKVKEAAGIYQQNNKKINRSNKSCHH